MDLARLEAFLADPLDDRIEQVRRLARPAGEGRAVDLETLRGRHLGLAVKRQVVIELGDDDVRERAERRLTAGNRLGRRRRLDDRLAGTAAILGPNVTHHAPADRHDIEQLVGIGTEAAQLATARRAGAGASGRFVDNLIAREMRRQRTDGCGPLGLDDDIGHLRVGGGGLGFILFERQLELCDLLRELLG